MTEDTAWAAGLFEGEGCIYAAGTRGRQAPTPALQLVTTDRDVILRFARIVQKGHLGRQASQRGQNKPLYAWRCGKDSDAVFVMRLLFPNLGDRRRARWQELRESYLAYRREEAQRAYAVCIICGSSFDTAHPKLALYCSIACKSAAQRKRKKEALV